MDAIKLYKYPRTPHLPWSLSLTDDDKRIQTLDAFRGRDIVVTEKMDGENTTMYQNYIHARSLDSANHPSRNWVKSFWGNIKHSIPNGWRVCGENLYAVHSIEYSDLISYFMAFSVWNEENVCLSWDDTLEWLALLNIPHVPVLFRGKFEDFVSVRQDMEARLLNSNKEGYVVRLSSAIPREQFPISVAKYVRENHVQTDEHWMHNSKIKVNGISKND